MNEQELRNLVREGIAAYAARHGATAPGAVTQQRPTLTAACQHPSHGMYTLAAGADTDGLCIIEPAVMCNHCGYCKSWGH